jgi:glycosyltransferase involved in cell wall biosynthesis
MIRNRNILCLSNPTWEGNYAKTIVELMKVFARENRVLYVDYQFTLKDVLATLTGKADAPIKRMYGLEPNLRQIALPSGHSVYVFTPPPILPINFLPPGNLYRLLLGFNARIVRNGIQKALKKLDMQTDLISVVAFNPSMGLPNARKFGERTLIYHCYDEIGAAVWAAKHGHYLEKEYMPLVDGVVVTSKGLLDSKKAYNPNTELVRNGVNFDLFHQGFSHEISPHKIIGYIGSIDTRLDYSLLDMLFTRYPEYSFEFVGRTTYAEGEARLKKHANVKVLGPRNATELPEFLKTCSAGIIPFARNEFTKGIYPLKINEYLAAGLPVVMTEFSDLSEFADVVSKSNDPETYARLLGEALESDTLEKRKARARVAQSNAWEDRVARISSFITKLEGHG